MLILAIDDDPFILEVLQSYVGSLASHELVTAESVADAYEILKNERRRFDCFLLDIQMPDINGVEFCRALRETSVYQRTPILMLTALTEKSYIVDAFSAGATDYITKPFEINSLKGRLSLIEQISVDAQSSPAIRPVVETNGNNALDKQQAIVLHQQQPISDVDGVIENYAMGNYATQLSRLSRLTDVAPHASKSHVGNRDVVRDAAQKRKFDECRALINEIPHALANGDFEIYLQPKVSLPKGSAYGFEALARWNHNGRVIAPSEFIDVAEQSGFIVEVDEFVLIQATTFVAKWNFQHGTNFSVSVNLSALHFSSRKIVEVVEAALANSKLPPQLLTLEITETVEICDWKQAQSIIADMQAIGCKVAIDDFGSGFSSLAYLRVTSADELKIDRSLVEELATSAKARSLLSSVFEIANNLNIQVVVEGIETNTQAAIVHEMGALQAQGYYFGRPQPATAAILTAMAGIYTAQQTQIG
jgi:EAL domain-containing protein (putative c-di-GMP-specific phosphodiesterase class I)/DNA-binding response OmpR family regulator